MAAEAEVPRCYAPREGRINLTCELDEGHDQGPESTWHKATYTDHQEVVYQGAHHVIDLTETVTWEPFSKQLFSKQLAATMRRVMAKRETEEVTR